MASGKGAIGGGVTGAGLGATIGSQWGALGGPMGMGLGAGIGALLGLFGGGGGQDAHPSPELERLYQYQIEQMQSQNPLVEAAYRLAFNRLPDAARAGLNEPNMDRAWAQLPAPDTGEYDQSPQVRNALRMMEMRQRMASPIVQAVTRLAMGRLPSSVQQRVTPPPYQNPNYDPETGRVTPPIIQARG